ncbi:uncharacterized protein LOC114350730, partial [Ostrinia furnacalis]|uniref:uncharacterized protein LOC114350730 n=1 Tax=Ostrinia furnacalis TaxID=93504 RepID=UPI00103BEE39
FAASNLNRDDVGKPKEMSFGGAKRLRLSSQSQKRPQRKGEIFASLRSYAAEAYGSTPMIRTTRIMRILSDRLTAAGLPLDKAIEGASAVLATLKKATESTEEAAVTTPVEEKAPKATKKTKAAAKEEVKDPRDETTQMIALSTAEIDEIVRVLTSVKSKSDPKWAIEAIDELKTTRARANRQKRGELSVECALFGRMVTSDIFSNINSAIQVSHAFTVHAAETERDYWTGVDDFKEENGEPGSGMIDTRRFGSGVFYQYALIDVTQLLDNLRSSFVLLSEEKIQEAAQDILCAYAIAFAQQNPTGHQNSFASHPVPEFVYVEVGNTFPTSAAAAYEKPITLRPRDNESYSDK